VALRLAASGMPVAVNYRVARDEAETIVLSLQRSGVEAVAVQADLSDPQQAALLVQQVEMALGPLAIVVNNAGITRDRLLVQMSTDDWDATWCTDLAGARAVSRAALQSMTRNGGGAVVNVSSVVGVTGNAGQANYAAAKSAMLGLTRELAVQSAKYNVRVNSVVPGYILTDATAHLTEQQQQAWKERIPMGRFASVDEVVGIITFLVSLEATYVTGQCIAVDGGFLAAAGWNFSS
jgi:3-oxoacyl-[acyl-carrier protein] reductase